MASILARSSTAALTAPPRMLLTAASRSAFSSTRSTLSSAKQPPPKPGSGSGSGSGQSNGNGNPEMPSFSLKNLGISRTTRRFLVAGILVLACMEGVAWVKFLPKVMGWDKKPETETQE